MPDEAAPLRPTLGAGVVEYETDPGYRWPADPLVRQRLTRWQDQKFGVIVHWGLYTALGEDGSWTLCRSRDEECMQIPSWFTGNDAEWQSHYEESRRTFSGNEFDATDWACEIAGSGARYVILTAKHHDGFSMYDTAYSSYRSTATEVPFGRDFIAEMSQAIAAHRLGLGMYFSKADWHHPGYWDPERPITDRFRNHDDPSLWEEFVGFTHAQVRELLTRYGGVDLLWLDAGWVKPPSEDLDIKTLAETARALQPGILVVDREVHSSIEDYRTPEQRVPAERLDYPWESCITLTDRWCTVPDAEPCKDIREVLELLVTIVARGGNLLLGIGPDADGRLPEDVASSLRSIGTWLDRFGFALFGTRPIASDVIVGNSTREKFVDDAGRTWWLTQAGHRVHLIAVGKHDLSEPLRVPLRRPPSDVRVNQSAQCRTTWRGGVLELHLGAAAESDGTRQPLPTTVVSIDLSDAV